MPDPPDTPSTTTFNRPNIAPPKPLVIESNTAASAENWKIWRQMWENYVIISGIDSQPPEYQTALFLHSIGADAMRIYNGLKFGTGENRQSPVDIINKFNSHFLGETKEFFERFKFNKRNQQDGETIDQYVGVLRSMSKTCGICDCMRDKLIMDRILLGVSDDTMTERCISCTTLDLNKTIDTCRAIELATSQLREMRKEEIHKVKAHQPKAPGQSKPASSSSSQYRKTFDPNKQRGAYASQQKCKFCRRSHIMKKEACPAWGKTCDDCGQKNHFKGSKKCKKNRKVHSLHEYDSTSESDSDESAAVMSVTVADVNSVRSENVPIFCEMEVNRRNVKLQVDCGATVNILPKQHVEGLTIRPEVVHLQMWNKSSCAALGKCIVKVKNPANQKKYKIDFVIVDDYLTPLLSRKAAECMELITVNYQNFEHVHAIVQPNFIEEFQDVFDNGKPGKLPGSKIHLSVEPDAEPVVRPPRTIPEALKVKVKNALDKLVETEVVTPVDDPTDWVNQMSVSTKKSGDIRICIDPRPLNLVLRREHYRLPVLDDVLPELSCAKKFSIFDLKSGYHHLVLDDESSLLTTFATPFGRYRWQRLPFGLKVSSEIFQKRLHQALEGLDGVRCIADDIIIFGRIEEEHDTRVRKFLEKCRTLGIVLNKDKCQIGVKEIPFMGHLVTDHGLKPDPIKIEAVINMKPPTDKAGVERLRGMVNYLAKFVPKLSEVLHPINMLTHNNVVFEWTSIQDKAFKQLKQLLTEAPVLAYFDSSKPLAIQCDASSRGLGAALLQDGRPLAYASRALTETETRYATIEKEMLAIIFSLEKWHQYTYGRPVIIYSDHKPLETITKKPLERAPKRLQGMLLRALAYDIEVRYQVGKMMVLADTLSRAFLPNDKGQEEFETVNALSYLTLPQERIDQIRQFTNDDESLQLLKTTIQSGWPVDKSALPISVSPYYHVRDELSVTDGLVFRGERLVIPKAMRNQIKTDIHIGHTGIDSCLRRAREYVYWPKMSQDIKQFISSCETCCEYSQSQPKETLMSHDIPDRPWSKIGSDLFSYKGNDYLITVCYNSNFWEIDRLYDTTSKTIINKTKAHFARYGIADYIVSDNGPQYTSELFQKFTRDWGITHNTISPHNSKANGKVESAVKSAKRMLKKTTKSNQDQYLALLNIRNTPTQGMDSSPAQRFLGRRTKTLIPTTDTLLQPRSPPSKHEMQQLQLNQQRQSKYYNRSATDLKPLKTGDTVRMKPFVLGKDKWKKAKVTRQLDERSYEVVSNGHTYRRVREHLRKTGEPFISNDEPQMDNQGIPDPIVNNDIRVPETVVDNDTLSVPETVTQNMTKIRSIQKVKEPEEMTD